MPLLGPEQRTFIREQAARWTNVAFNDATDALTRALAAVAERDVNQGIRLAGVAIELLASVGAHRVLIDLTLVADDRNPDPDQPQEPIGEDDVDPVAVLAAVGRLLDTARAPAAPSATSGRHLGCGGVIEEHQEAGESPGGERCTACGIMGHPLSRIP